LAGPLFGRLGDGLQALRFPGSTSYWERRYQGGGTSGRGSRGSTAAFKAEVVNSFVERQGVTSVIEFGCGDGYQLGLARYPRYVGLDTSRTAVKTCGQRFGDDRTKAFLPYEPASWFNPGVALKADLALSLDVVFHLVEDDVFETYMGHLFACGTRFVIVYSTNVEHWPSSPHIRHRRFTDWVERNAPGWRLSEEVGNPAGAVSGGEPLADFYVYVAEPRSAIE
jgi:SAM-dependent methyltransferase